jgi:hypothetical protein
MFPKMHFGNKPNNGYFPEKTVFMKIFYILNQPIAAANS